MDDINEYQAGRALDTLIAREVFGHSIGKGELGYWVTTGNLKTTGSEKSTWHELPRYSTDIRAVFLIVEHLHKLGRDVGIMTWADGNVQVMVRDHLIKPGRIMDGKDEVYTAGAVGKIALVICRAALKAVREDMTL